MLFGVGLFGLQVWEFGIWGLGFCMLPEVVSADVMIEVGATMWSSTTSGPGGQTVAS